MITGSWAKKAYQESARREKQKVIASSQDQTFSYIPKVDPKDFTPDADSFHICVNNTIYGTRFKPENIPGYRNVPLVGDMSSNILSEVYDVSKFGLIYAGAQKNMGPVGVTAGSFVKTYWVMPKTSPQRCWIIKSMPITILATIRHHATVFISANLF